MVTVFSIPLILAGAAILIITYSESAQAPQNLGSLLFYTFGLYTIFTGLALEDE